MDVRKMSWLAMFTALSAVGAFIKVPSPVGSVAFDAFPALLAAVLLGGVPGAIVGALGHLISSLLVGLPLGPFHIMIALEMALLVWLLGMIVHSGKKFTAIALFLIGNTVIAPLPFIFLISPAFFTGMLPSLFVGSLLNLVLASVVIPRLKSLPFLQLHNGESIK
ncbi:ECF transporter S component [Fredinandcohnia quinoae]|uniref:ECF transporter S component n=1 Tax=Fredinandcohnia quinoae TaxID=2918902 RepID=A0AAW5ECB2_9BACI|nr:ECF transporter S component [Fredinandcohnia sp. SECRCQ15]MCH1626409.1 ECF transporter S component [Fredinandcohnia sp. SECRCQ15]